MKYHYSVDLDTDNSLSIILKHIKPNSKVFEFGPADGYMTEYLKHNLGCEVYCLEIDELAAAKAKVFCDKMIVADLNREDWLQQIDDQFNSFDYLIFADVLEHLLTPEEVLGVLTEKLLKDDGKVLISVPHIGHTAVILQLMEGRFEYRETGLLDRTHITFFTRDNLNKLLDKSGLSLIAWHNVCMYPDQTELRSTYSSVPSAVQEFLKNKIDAHVYQFVTISEKKHIKELNVYHDEVIETGDYRYSKFIQLFWNTGNGFSENNSKRLPLHVEGEYHQYVFEFDVIEGPLLSVRLDPTNFPCFVNMRAIKIWGLNSLSNQYEELENEPFVAVHGLVIEKGTDGTDIFSYNEDPHLQKDFLNNDLKDYRKFRVQIELLYDLKLKPQMLYKIQKKEEDLNLRNNLIKIENNYSFLEAEIRRTNDLSSELFGALSSELLNAKNSEIEILKAQVSTIQEKNKNLQSELLELKSSKSWRLASIFRNLRNMFR